MKEIGRCLFTVLIVTGIGSGIQGFGSFEVLVDGDLMLCSRKNEG